MLLVLDRTANIYSWSQQSCAWIGRPMSACFPGHLGTWSSNAQPGHRHAGDPLPCVPFRQIGALVDHFWLCDVVSCSRQPPSAAARSKSPAHSCSEGRQQWRRQTALQEGSATNKDVRSVRQASKLVIHGSATNAANAANASHPLAVEISTTGLRHSNYRLASQLRRRPFEWRKKWEKVRGRFG